MQAPNTVVGPDSVPYCAYKPIAGIVAEVRLSVIHACRGPVRLPNSWKELVTVFIPKKGCGPLASVLWQCSTPWGNSSASRYTSL
eukprot:6461006-Amphidinium_carterae.1